jgi:hypothetical protein
MALTPARRSLVVMLLTLSALALAACTGGATPGTSASAGASTGASSQPSGGGGGDVERLAATIPTQVGDVALTVTSGDLTALRDVIPNYAELVQRLNNLFIQPSDVLGAVGRPTDGGDDPTVGALQFKNLPPGGLGLLAFMQAWVSSIPGATAENTNLGKPVVAVTFEDGSLPLYYYLYDSNRVDVEPSDTLYFVRSADQALVEDALAQLP